MELRRIDQKENVNKFEIAQVGLLLWQKGEIYLDDNLIFENEPNAVFSFQDVLFIVTNDWKDSVCIDLNSRTENILENVRGMDIFLDSKSILVSEWNDDYTKSFKQKIDLDSGNIIWEVEAYFGKPFLGNGCLFASLDSKLFKIDPETGNFIWELNLADKHNSYSINGQDTPIDIQGYIGMHIDCLYVKVGNRLIIGIDSSSGEEIFCYEYNGVSVLLDNLRLDCDKGVIFSIGSAEYFELNLSSHKSEIVTLKVNDIETTRMGTWEDNIIYFWEGGTSSNFGLFDRDTKEVRLVQTLNVSGYPAIKDIKHGHGKVYVLDGNNQLHIFEQLDYPA